MQSQDAQIRQQAEQISRLLEAHTWAAQKHDAKKQEMEQMLSTLNCTASTKDKIYNMLKANNLTKLDQLSKSQMQQLLDSIKPQCQYQGCTTILTSSNVYDSQVNCDNKHPGCLGKSPPNYWVFCHYY